MSELEEVRRLYQAYEEEFHQRELVRRPGEGIFGLGMGPKNYPCHSRFAQELEALLQDITARRPDSAQVRALLDYIYSAPQARPALRDAVYWMLLAAQSLTLDLIALLDGGDARALYDSARRTWPRRERLPAQDKVLSALKARFH